MSIIRSHPKKISDTVLIFDWDQTVTRRGGGSNERATHFGFDYIISPEKITEKYLVPGFGDTLIAALDKGYSVMIGTSQPMAQIIRKALIALIGERADEITICCAKPEKLICNFSIIGDAELNQFLLSNVNLAGKLYPTFRLPLHTKDIEKLISEFRKYANDEMKKFLTQNKELDSSAINDNWNELKEALEVEFTKRCAAGISDEWKRCYEKQDWQTEDVAHVISLMDRLGVDDVGVEESKKEVFLWAEIKRRYADPALCKKIVYVDDSASRLGAFQRMRPSKFSATDIRCITAIPDENRHFVTVLEALSLLEEFPLKNVEDLNADEAKALIKRLQLTPVRLKKFIEKSPIQTFFTIASGAKKLPQTIVRLDDDRYMIIGDIPKSAGVGMYSKVKSQTLIKVSEDEQSFKVEKQGLVKIQFLVKDTYRDISPELKDKFYARIKNEAARLVKYNDLAVQDVQLQVSQVSKGVRIYMSMPPLGIALSHHDIQQELNEKQRMNVFYKALERVERIHQGGDVHFDLTLNNILYDSATGNVRICDFGHAQASGTQPELILNKSIAPPKFSGAAEDSIHFGPAYDVFSLGVSMAQFLGFQLRDEKILKTPKVEKKAAVKNEGYGESSDEISASESKAEEISSKVEEAGYGYKPEIKNGYSGTTKPSFSGADELFDFDDRAHLQNPEVIALLKQMLHPDPRQRPTILECKARLEQLGVTPTAQKDTESPQFKT